MDALSILTNPVEQAKNRVFSPLQASSKCGSRMLLTKAITVAQMLCPIGCRIPWSKDHSATVEDKYGEWAQTYMELYPYRVSKKTLGIPQG
jgi:hypothetical protein